MTEVELDIKQWGKRLWVRLPAAVVRAAQLHAEQRVRISVEDRAIVIRPIDDAVLTVKQHLVRFDAVGHGGEADQSKGAGAEQW